MASALSISLLLLPLLLLLALSSSHVEGSASSTCEVEAFIRCFREQTTVSAAAAAASRPEVLTPKDASYGATLVSTLHNDRFEGGPSRPAVIVLPTHEGHVRAAIVCGRRHGLRLRVRSGGHDFEGLSYRSALPHARFAMLDMAHLRSVEVDVEGKTAWVAAGATIGELYHEIHASSPTLGFPGGEWPTVGVGGQFGGGGAGYMLRKYGIAGDNILDARIVDVNGQVLDRESMGEDLFWAIRGGGAASFCIALAFKIQLVDVPPSVAVFNLTRPFDEHTAGQITKWQTFATETVRELYFYVVLVSPPGSTENHIQFRAMYLGSTSELFAIVSKGLPEIGLRREHCVDMSMADTIMLFTLLDGVPQGNSMTKRQRFPVSLKPKMDFVREPISEDGVAATLRWLEEHSAEVGYWRISMEPFGGRIDEIAESALPYPHRKGTMYKILSIVLWQKGSEEHAEEVAGWIRRFCDFMTPYVSSNPRQAYYNVRDLDLGWNREEGKADYEEAKQWGVMYFKGNFRRLAAIKARVDPDNYFWSEQSIPPLPRRDHAEL